RILKVDGEDLDPLRLPSRCFEQAGRPMTFEVERHSANGLRTTQILTATPDATPPWTEPYLENEDLDVSGLGLCFPVTTHVVAVRPGSPAARAGLKPGDVINAVTLKPAKLREPAQDKAPGQGSRSTSAQDRSTTIRFDDQSTSWVALFSLLQDRPAQ